MNITISLPQTPSPGQVADAHALIDFIAGGFKAALTTTTAAAPQPVAAAPAPPPPPPPPPAPQADSAFQQQVPAPGPVQTDKNGLPWDARIHSSSKAINADGTWKHKRGVQEAVVTTVTAELRAAIAAAPVGHVDAPQPVAAAPAPPPPPPPPPAPAPVAAANPFVDFMKWTGPLLGAQKMTQAQLQAAVASVGLADLTALSARPDLIPSVEAYIRATVPGV